MAGTVLRHVCMHLDTSLWIIESRKSYAQFNGVGISTTRFVVLSVVKVRLIGSISPFLLSALL